MLNTICVVVDLNRCLKNVFSTYLGMLFLPDYRFNWSNFTGACGERGWRAGMRRCPVWNGQRAHRMLGLRLRRAIQQSG